MYEQMNLTLACEIKEMLSCRSIDITAFKNAQMVNKKKAYELVCDEECFLAERNRNMAQALQIDPSTIKPKVIYSDFLKNYAREEPAFVFDLEKKFEAIVIYYNLIKKYKNIFIYYHENNFKNIIYLDKRIKRV
jgi:hypothetical protein